MADTDTHSKTWVLTGEAVLGYPSYGMTVAEVFYSLPENFMDGSSSQGDVTFEEVQKQIEKQLAAMLEENPAEPPLKSVAQAYREAIDWLDENYAYFLTHVLNLGIPVSNPHMPTAAVFFNDLTKKLEFHINPELTRLETEEFAFVLAHETMHVRLRHLDVLKRFYSRITDEEEKIKEANKANCAADVVINDYLEARGFTLPVTPPSSSSANSGTCSISFPSQEAMEKFLSEHPELFQPGGKPRDGQGQDGQDRANKAGGEATSKFPSDADSLGGPTQTSISSGVSYGFGTTNEISAWSKDTGTSLEWGKLMARVNPELFSKFGIGKHPRKDFHTPHRGTAFFPEVNLPVKAVTHSDKLRETDKIPFIVLALDTSGSCSHLVDKFITLAKSIPKKRVKLWVCTFSTNYMELDLDNPHYQCAGTDFSAIENYIQFKMTSEKRKKYPDTVVVVTDGVGVFSSSAPPEQHWGNWHWLLDEGYTNISENRPIGKDQIYPLSDYIK